MTNFVISGKRNVKHFRKSIDEKNTREISELSHKMLTLFRQLEARDIVELLVQLEDMEELLSDEQQYFLLSNLALEKIETLLQVIFFPSFFGLRPTPFIMSENKLIVVESRLEIDPFQNNLTFLVESASHRILHPLNHNGSISRRAELPIHPMMKMLCNTDPVCAV